nr:SCO family protein [Pseudoalteromonas denitrificans]
MRALFILLLGCISTGCFEIYPPETKALVYAQARELKPFVLEDQNAKKITNETLQGQWNLLFLGYTHCPDICPLTLAKLNQAYQELSKQYALKVWFVSVDPARDLVEKRKQYIEYFNPDFIGATGPHAELFPFVRDLGLIYAITSGQADDEYSVDHSASIALVDGKGKLRAIFKPEFIQGQPPLINTKQLISDFKLIADFY